MLFVKKALAIALFPSGLVLLLLLCGLLLRRKLLVWIGTLLFLLFSMPLFSDALIHNLESTAGRTPVIEVGKADMIVVPGGMTEQVEGAPLGEWKDAADRFEGGIDLYRAGKAPLLVFTRGRLPWRMNEVPEGELLARRAEKLGIPAKAIRLTGLAGNTAGEAVELRRLSEEGKIGKGNTIILVTSAYHMPRAQLLFERQGFRVIPYRVDFQVGGRKPLTLLSFLPDAEAFLHSEKAMREMIGLVYYRVLRTQD